jgi:hypothetical protein
MLDDTQEAAQDEQPAAPVAAYMAFELIKERVLFSHWNNRTELHGDEPTPACDLKFELSAPNSILKKIRPGLVESFYEHDRQQDVEGDFMRKLKHPQIGAIPYDWEIPRLKLTIHDPHSEHDSVTMAGGRANKFKITMLDGGTVKLQFRCQFSDYDEEVAPSLIRCLKQNVQISLSSAEEEAKLDNFEQVGMLGNKPEDMSPARAAAEEAFKKIAEEEAAQQLAQAADGMQDDKKPDAISNVAPITAAKPRGKRTANGAEIVAE